MFSREQNIYRLREETFDLLVIGGGITGVGVARDAAMRGLSVAMVESKDFASGTSSKSSKLMHGGIRYLEQFAFGLVAEASRERRMHEYLLSPHLTDPVPFMIPVYNWSPHSLPAVWSGVALYNMLALFRNHGTRYLTRDAALKAAPQLNMDGLRGGAQYYDVTMDDARLCLENARSANDYGGVCVNYISVRGFEKNSSGQITGVWVRDNSPLSETLANTNLGKTSDFIVRAKTVVNATGPWSDYIRRLDDVNSEPVLRPTKGVHIIVDNEALGTDRAFVLTAKQDNRVFFSIPWYGRTIIGTTDTDYDPAVDGSLNDIHATQNEIDYLLEGVKRTFPSSTVTEDSIISSYAGLRPLVRAGGAGKSESDVSREHAIFASESGMFTIVGGKYTTYRAMAEAMVNRVVRYLNKHDTSFSHKRIEGCRTHREPIIPVKGNVYDYQDRSESMAKEMGEELAIHLMSRYGPLWLDVAEMALTYSDTRKKIFEDDPTIFAEALYARENEMAMSLEDFFRRRTTIALTKNLANRLNAVAQAADILLGKDLEQQPTVNDCLRWQGLEFQAGQGARARARTAVDAEADSEADTDAGTETDGGPGADAGM